MDSPAASPNSGDLEEDALIGRLIEGVARRAWMGTGTPRSLRGASRFAFCVGNWRRRRSRVVHRAGVRTPPAIPTPGCRVARRRHHFRRGVQGRRRDARRGVAMAGPVVWDGPAGLPCRLARTGYRPRAVRDSCQFKARKRIPGRHRDGSHATSFRRLARISAERLLAVAERVRRDDAPDRSCSDWLASPYRPTPTIIEAAVRLYEGHGVRELSHRHAHNLDLTTEMLVEEIERAQRERRRVVCFVTGIPGAGKTLTGLNVVHDPELRGDSAAAGIFLSGNGPLVKVVREALVMHQTAQGRRRRDCAHEVGTFIQNVHQFLRYHRENPEAAPHEHVVVFDEAQRAWDQAQMSRKHDVAGSEAAELLDVMERLPDWSVVIALVGGGQEIYLGEAGLEEWGRALAAAWTVGTWSPRRKSSAVVTA